MPTKIIAQPVGLLPSDIAARRIIRLALIVALSLWFSQVFEWPLSFLVPILVIFVLPVPDPAPPFMEAVKFTLKLAGALVVFQLLIPVLDNAHLAGLLLVLLLLFTNFYNTAAGGDQSQ